MWSAIIQAIDHACGRLHDGMSSGIKVANSQHGGAATNSNVSTDTAEQTSAATEQAGESTSSVGDELKSKLSADKAADTSAAESATESASESSASEGAAEAASSLLSDEKTKNAQNCASKTVSGWHKARNYATGVSQGFANAAAAAQGKSGSTTNTQSVDWATIKDNISNFGKKKTE